MVEALRATDGSAIAVGDGEILRWQRLLAEKEGIFTESSAAAALAGLEALVARGADRPRRHGAVAGYWFRAQGEPGILGPNGLRKAPRYEGRFGPRLGGLEVLDQSTQLPSGSWR